MVGRLKGIKFATKQVRPASTNFHDTLKPEGPDTLPLSQEETWKKRCTTQKRKSKYFSPPPPAKRIRVLVAHKGAAAQKKKYMSKICTKTDDKDKKISSSCPAPQEQKGCCPRWGGQGNTGYQTVSMTNACTVDNLLYTLHLAVKRKPGIKNDLQTNANLGPWISTLLQVHELFEKKEWTQGKLL